MVGVLSLNIGFLGMKLQQAELRWLLGIIKWVFLSVLCHHYRHVLYA